MKTYLNFSLVLLNIVDIAVKVNLIELSIISKDRHLC